MEVGGQQTQDHGGSWAQYAKCKNMYQFGNLKSPDNNQQPFIKAKVQNLDNKKKQGPTNLPSNNDETPKEFCLPTTPVCTESPDLVLVDSSKEPQSSFGSPHPLRYGPKTPQWARVNAEVTETTPRPEPSLDDLYLENPEKKLQAIIEPGTMNLAANVVLHVASESGYQWFKKWCPHMDMREVFGAIGVEGEEGKFASKLYNVPQDALDTRYLTTTLAEMYQQCRNVHPKDSGDTEFPKLLKLIDKCAIFLGTLKDCERMALLKETRSTFQQIRISLDGKKASVLEQAKANLKTLNKLYQCGTPNSKVDSEAPKQNRKTDELEILDTTVAEFDICRRTSETQMLDQLNVLLASTVRWPPRPSQFGFN
ncbi:hypothetical protein GGS24DRAFT_504417 [Hypoxylon argillaceum]|nr:hypothetical protein GGS24DRAFT_504417 [Hypoxylon argillaceum]